MSFRRLGFCLGEHSWWAMFLYSQQTLGKIELPSPGFAIAKVFWLLLLLTNGSITSFTAAACQALPDEPTSGEAITSAFEIASTTLTPAGLKITPPAVSLGFLRANESYKVLITLKNTSDQSIRFDKFRTSCQCSGFTVSEYKIKSGQSIHAELIWKIPASSEVVDIGTSVGLLLEGREIIQFTFQAKLANNIFVGDTGFGTRTNDGFTSWKMPLLVSSPVKLNELKAVLSDELRGFTAKIVAGEVQPDGIERGFVLIDSHEEIEGGEYTFGVLKLTHPANPVANEKNLTLQCKLPVTLSPLVLGFHKKDEVYVASAMVQIDGSTVDAAELSANKGKILITCSIDGHELPVTVKPLNGRIFRVSVSMSESRKSEMETDSNANWNIRFDGLSYDFKTSVSIR